MSDLPIENIDIEENIDNLVPASIDEEASLKISSVPTPLPGLDKLNDQEVLRAVLSTNPDQLINWHMCSLPSDGRFYGWADGIISVRPMGTGAEKAMATQQLVASGQASDRLFKECCKFPEGFDPLDLLVGDRVFLLFFIRGITYGNKYEFSIECTNEECGRPSTHVYDINNLAQTIKRPDSSLSTEPFKVVLPYMSELTGREFWVGLRFLRGYDGETFLAKRRAKQRSMSNVAKPANPFARKRQQQEMRNDVDSAITDNLEQVIQTVMGSDNKIDIKNFVQRMHSRDSSTIREWLKDNTPGIDTKINITCPECSTELTVELPITESFFRSSRTQ